jgi:hypothetical protein
MSIESVGVTRRVQPVAKPHKHQDHPVFQNLLLVQSVLTTVVDCECNCVACRERAKVANLSLNRVLDIFA